MQRVQGTSRLQIVAQDGQSRLKTLYQAGAAKIRLPKVYDHLAIEAVLINTAGGLTDGDSLSVDIKVGAGAELVVTTQACEKVYRSLGGPAVVENKLQIGAGASLCWLPQETIFFDRANLRRTLKVEVVETGRFLAFEPLIFGRAAMGETEITGRLHDRWRVYQAGKLVYAEDNRLEGDISAQLKRSAVAQAASAFVAGLYVGPDCEARLAAFRGLCAVEGVTAGASLVRQHLVLRAVARDSLSLRRWMQQTFDVFEQRDLPRAWSC